MVKAKWLVKDRRFVPMKWLRVLGIIALVMYLTPPAAAVDWVGTLPEAVAALKPPPPAELPVAVLPVWAPSPRVAALARACILLNLERRGFALAPSGKLRPSAETRDRAPQAPSPESVAIHAAKVDILVKVARARDPTARLEREDALGLGERAKARWVIFGEVENLNTAIHKRILFTRKVGSIDMRLSLLDVPTGEVVYWAYIRDTGTGGVGFWMAPAQEIERHLLTRTINRIMDDIAKALPPHKVGSEVTEAQVQRLAETIGFELVME